MTSMTSMTNITSMTVTPYVELHLVQLGFGLMCPLLSLLQFLLEAIAVLPPRGHLLLGALHLQLKVPARAVERGVLVLCQF